MKNEITKFFFYLTALLTPLFASAQSSQNTLNGLKQTGDKVEGVSREPLSAQVGNIVGAILSFVGVIFLLLMIYGGLMWMTARGNEEQVQKARSTIVAAIIGLVVVMAAYAITSFIGGALAGN